MRLFQNAGGEPSCLTGPRLRHQKVQSFKAQIANILNDRYGGVHILAPVLNGHESAFFTYGDDESLQRTWGREMGLSTNASLADILLAQIESHRTEVFYNIDPMRYDSNFVRRLPGCVRKAIAWRAAPSHGGDFSEYDLTVCNFNSILNSYKKRGWEAAYFAPAHDPAMDGYAANCDRPIDVLFVGSYSRHHMRRAAVLEAVAGLRRKYTIEFHLACSRFTRVAESPFCLLAPLGRYRRPGNIRAVWREPVYGRGLYALISKAKIVLNGAIDMSGADRGNMRCFESLGCKSLLFSDGGLYPDGMVHGKTMITYDSPADVIATLTKLLNEPESITRIANAGYTMTSQTYSKKHQWSEFCRLTNDI